MKNRFERLFAVILALAMLLSAAGIAEAPNEAEDYAQQAPTEADYAEPVEEAVPEVEEFTLDGTQLTEDEQEILAPPEAEYMDEVSRGRFS